MSHQGVQEVSDALLCPGQADVSTECPQLTADSHASSSQENGCCSSDYGKEVLSILHIQIPVSLTAVFQFFIQTVSIIMCGHLSTTEMDAASLANSFINIVGLCVGNGLSSACDTFFSQTYGSVNKIRVGLHLQRSLFVMYMCLTLVYCFYLNIRLILPFLGQDLVVSEMTVCYIFYFMPGLFFDYTFIILSKYLQVQNMVYPPLICAFVANVFNITCQYVAIYVFQYRYLASAVCQALSSAVMSTSLLAYILVSRVYEPTWCGWSREFLYNIGSFLRIGIPGILLVFLEFGSFEIGVFVIGTLDTVQLAAMTIISQCATLCDMPGVGLTTAVTIRVGQNLGSKNLPGIRRTYKTAVAMSTVVSVTLAVFFFTFSNVIPRWFSNDEEVVSATVLGLKIYSIFPLVDGVSATAVGVLQGCGRQFLAAFGNFIAYEVIALPVGIPLALLTYLKVSGFWVGMFAGVFIQACLYVLIGCRLNWQREMKIAEKRSCLTYSSKKSSILNIQTDTDKEFEEKANSLPPFKHMLIKLVPVSLIILIVFISSVISCIRQNPLVDLSTLCSNATFTNTTNCF